MTIPYVIPEQLDNARTFWLEVARAYKWAGPLEPFHVQVWVDDVGNVVDSVSFSGMTQDYILRHPVGEGEPCRDCGMYASEGDGPMKDHVLGGRVCWDCYRSNYEEEEDEPCRECGEDASEDDRPMKDDALCWDCYRDIYEEEEE